MAEIGVPSTADIDSSLVHAHYIITFDVLSILGLLFLFPLFLLAVLSPRIKRASTWYMVIGSWVVASMSNLILLGQQTGPPPPTGICLMQAMLIYASPVLSSFSAVAFMLHVYTSILHALGSKSTLSRTNLGLLHIVPSIFFLCVLVEVLIIGLLNPEDIQRNPSHMYCNIAGPTSHTITASLIIVAMLAIIVIEILIAVTLSRVWKSSEKLDAFKNQDSISLDVIIRVALFGFSPIISLVLSSFQYLSQRTMTAVKLEVVAAAFPFCAILIFGTQKDILQVCMFWKKTDSRVTSMHSGISKL